MTQSPKFDLNHTETYIEISKRLKQTFSDACKVLNIQHGYTYEHQKRDLLIYESKEVPVDSLFKFDVFKINA